MPDIFLSYNREDEAAARRFAEAFAAQGMDVWWDSTLRAGEAYDQVTEKALTDAKAVVVLWSKKSVESRWVRAEATQADRNGTLVPAMIEPCKRPIMFELTQTAELAHWQGAPDDKAWLAFLADVRRFVEAGPAKAAKPGAPPRASAAADAAHATPSVAAWAIIQDSLDPAEYSDFEALHPGTAEVILARRHRRQLEAWAALDKNDPEAIAAFRDTPQLFAALKRAASARFREQQARKIEEEAADQAAKARTKAIVEEQSRRAPRSKSGALWRDAIPDLPATACPEMVTIPPGTFLMGSPATEERREGYDGHEEPQHEVRIDHSFALGRYAVMVEEFAAFVAESGHDMGASARIFNGKEWVDTPGKGWRDPGFSQTGRDPVCCVNWHDSQAYIAWLNGKLDLQGRADAYRLPSEAEWEYACRAGTTTPFSFGATISTAQANYDGRVIYGAGKRGEFRAKTMPVGSFRANAFGLYDMHGNLFEWCEDIWHDNYTGAPNDGSAWTADGDPSSRVLRGGSWVNNPRILRSASRVRFIPTIRDGYSGFRVARTLSLP